MRTIKRLTLENFQSHKFTVVDFEDGLNALVGPTDSGKTAILRALKWVLYNEPQGDAFIRQGESEARVQVEFSDGIMIERYRTKSKNGYKISYPNGEEAVFEGFGSQVPEEVFEASKMPKISLRPGETRSLNMAEQLEGPFLLTDNPALKAAAIGKLVQADVVDYALGQVNLDLRNKKKDQRDLEENLDQVSRDLEAYAYLEDLEKTIRALESLEETIKEKTLRLERLQDLERTYSNIRESIMSQEEIRESLKNLKEVEISYLEAFNKISLLKNLEKIGLAYGTTKKRLEVNESIRKRLQDLGRAQDLTLKIEEKNQRLRSLDQFLENLKRLDMRKKSVLGAYKKLENVDQAFETYRSLEDLEKRLRTYEEASKNLSILKMRIKNGEGYISHFQDLDKCQDVFESLQKNLERLRGLKEKEEAFRLLRKKISYEEERLNHAEKMISSIEGAYRDLIKEMKVCPTCKRPFDLNNTDEIIRHLSE